jgi:PAS domain S-box-containing protein
MDDRDISKEELLNRLNNFLELLDALPDAVFEIDTHGNIIYLNKTALDKLCVSKNDLAKGINFFDYIEEDFKIDQSIKKAHEAECVLVPKGRTTFPAILFIVPVIENDKLIRYRVTAKDISRLKRAEREQQSLLSGLQKEVVDIKALRGFIPICAHCKRIRDDSGKWHSFEDYIREHTEAEFSHSLCPDCIASLYPDLFEQQSDLGLEE